MPTQQAILAQKRLTELSKSLQDKTEYRGTDGKVRHKCFLSYHVDDAEEALAFVTKFDSVFIPRAIGVSDDAPWIDSDDTDYIMQRIRDEYLRDSTVTIVLVGKCTWARKFVDWEVYSTLRNDSRNRLSGLLTIRLPSTASEPPKLPDRVSDNVIRDKDNNDTGYARYNSYPTTASSLQTLIQDAFDAPTTRPKLIVNSRARKLANSAC